jgi:hypothetical protein
MGVDMAGSRFAAFCGLSIALAFAGCGDSHGGRVEITGTVKLRGQPIRDGAILTFVPMEKQGTEAQATTEKGQFKIPQQNGLRPGKYFVQATAADAKTAANPDPNAGPGPGGGTNTFFKELVPKAWNDKKHEVTVTKEGPNNFDIDIP